MDHVYVMRDPRNHNDIKVGLSINPLNRRKQFYRTNTPLPFDIYAVWAVADHRKAEKIAHAVLADHGINERREWFEIAPIQSSLWFPGIQGDYDTTSTDLDALLEIIEEEFEYCDMPYHSIDDYDELVLSISLEDISFLSI
ncbi:TPA: GIY-YIG nuclease family protein [Vibrio harveyi]